MKTGVYVQTWHTGGVASFCQRLANGLAADGQTVDLILATPYGKRDEAGQRAYEQLLQNPAVPVHCLHLHAFHPRERPWRAAEGIAALGCDALVLSAHQAIAGGLGHLPPHLAVVGVAHTDDDDTYAEFDQAAPFCDAYVGVSTTITETLCSRSLTASLPIRHIPYGVPFPSDHEADEAAPASNPPARILTVSRLQQHQKRILDLPLIWLEYRKQGGQGTLTICGPGEEMANLRAAFAEDMAANRVQLLGAVPVADMPAVYARHDILLSVSAFEGLPISVLEAAVQGLYPVLSQIRSGHREIIEALGVGRLCAVGDIAGFAAALAQTAAEVDKLRRQRSVLREKGRSLFSLAQMVNQYDQWLRALTSAKARQPHRPGCSPAALARPRVDCFRRLLRRWKYSRHYGWH